MTSVDLLLRGGIVVTLADDVSVYRPGAIAILGDRIVALGDETSILARYTSSDVVDCRGGIVIPGLVNAHGHAALALLRGFIVPPSIEATSPALPLELREMSVEESTCGLEAALVEMIRSGTTTFADSYHYEGDLANIVEGSGMRAVLGEIVSDLAMHGYKIGPDRLRRWLEAFVGRWESHLRVRPAIAPHAAHTASRELLKDPLGLAREANLPILTQAAESRQEIDFVASWFKCRPIRLLDDLGVLGARTVVAHVALADREDISRLADRGAKIAHCAQSAMARGIARSALARFSERGVSVALGSDDACSHGSLDMLEELKAACLWQGRGGDARSHLAYATIQGARALGLDSVTGSLVAGKLADIVVLDSAPLALRDPIDPHDAVVYSATGRDVVHTIVSGRFVMRDRVVLTLDEEDVARRFAHRRSQASLRLSTGQLAVPGIG